jgi:hypothetical protein
MRLRTADQRGQLDIIQASGTHCMGHRFAHVLPLSPKIKCCKHIFMLDA